MTLRDIIERGRGPGYTWIRRCVWGLLALNIADNIPLLMDKSHAHTWLEYVPTFWGVFGLIGCILIILASKAFGHAGIMKREDYYDD